MTDVNRAAIAAVHPLIEPHIRRTPTLRIDGADIGLAPGAVTLKLELMQHSGSFKARGAFVNLLTRSVPRAGVVAASGGNHGAAVAYAAMRLGVPAKIFVPTISSPAKIQRIRDYGADLEVTGERYADALAASEAWAGRSGALMVHAFDQPETLLGQGTIGLELDQQEATLDTVLVSVGGGGLIGGIAADSLAPARVGEHVFPIAQRHVERVVLVSDAEIREAQERLWQTARVVAEPGGSAAFAALLSGRYQPRAGERVGVLVSGGNTIAVDFSR